VRLHKAIIAIIVIIDDDGNNNNSNNNNNDINTDLFLNGSVLLGSETAPVMHRCQYIQVTFLVAFICSLE
jgi:hypothetical protein